LLSVLWMLDVCSFYVGVGVTGGFYICVTAYVYGGTFVIVFWFPPRKRSSELFGKLVLTNGNENMICLGLVMLRLNNVCEVLLPWPYYYWEQHGSLFGSIIPTNGHKNQQLAK